MLTPFEVEEIKTKIYTIKSEDLELRKKEVLNKLNQEKLIDHSNKYIDALAEMLTWIDQRIEGLPQEGLRSLWFRTKRRAKYLKPI